MASLQLTRTIHSEKDLELKSIKSWFHAHKRIPHLDFDSKCVACLSSRVACSVWSLEGRSLVISDGSAEIECVGVCAWLCMRLASE